MCEKQSEIRECLGARVCARRETEERKRRRVRVHEYMHAEKHVWGRSDMLPYSHPKRLWCLLCYSTLCCDSSTDLINLLLALFTQWICELYSTGKCVRLQCRPVTWTNWNYVLTHPPVNSPGHERCGKEIQGTATWTPSSMKTSKAHDFFFGNYFGQKVQARASGASLTKDDRHCSGRPFLLTRGQ